MLTSPFYDSSSFSDWFGLVIEQPRKSCLFLGLHQKLCSLRLYYRSSLNTHQTCKATILSPPPSKQAFLVPGHPKPESRSDGTRGSQRMAAEQDLQGLDDEHDEHDELALD